MEEESHFLDPSLEDTDRSVENSLRPRTLKEFIGQPKIKEGLGIAIQAAIHRAYPGPLYRRKSPFRRISFISDFLTLHTRTSTLAPTFVPALKRAQIAFDNR